MANSTHFLGYSEDEKPIEVIGYVIAIDTPDDLNTDDETRRQILFSGITADGDQITITVKLEIADHIVACQVYKDGAEIKLVRTIKKSGAKWIMSSYTAFHIIS